MNNIHSLETAGHAGPVSSRAGGRTTTGRSEALPAPYWIQFFIHSGGAILLMAALIRFVIASGDAQILSRPDPLLGVQLRYAVLAVGIIELAVAWFCLFGKSAGLQCAWLAWLGTNYLVFQAGLLWAHCHPQGTCLGSLTDPLHLARGLTGDILGLLPLYLMLGVYAALAVILLPRPAKTATTTNRHPQPVAANPGAPESVPAAYVRFLKIACAACGGHIEFPTNFFGEQIPCPHCRAAVTLQKSVTLKMTCPACAGHLEFPEHALGQKIPCPHCQTEITLTKSPATR